MGAIVKLLEVKSEKEERLNLYFDSGSPFTFVKTDAARRLGGMLKLPRNVIFSGIGNGQFYASHLIHMEVKLLDIWCRHASYVIPNEVLEPGEDILIGHDFMQRYDIRLNLRERDIILDRDALLRAQKVR